MNFVSCDFCAGGTFGWMGGGFDWREPRRHTASNSLRTPLNNLTSHIEQIFRLIIIMLLLNGCLYLPLLVSFSFQQASKFATRSPSACTSASAHTPRAASSQTARGRIERVSGVRDGRSVSGSIAVELGVRSIRKGCRGRVHARCVSGAHTVDMFRAQSNYNKMINATAFGRVSNSATVIAHQPTSQTTKSARLSTALASVRSGATRVFAEEFGVRTIKRSVLRCFRTIPRF